MEKIKPYPKLSLKLLVNNMLKEFDNWFQISLIEENTIRIVEEKGGAILHATKTSETNLDIKLWVVKVDRNNRELSSLALYSKETETPDYKNTLQIPTNFSEAKKLLDQNTQRSQGQEILDETTLTIETVINRLLYNEIRFTTTENRIPELLKRAPGIRVHSFGGNVPFQAEGTWYGYWYYFRYRSGYVTLAIADTPEGTTLKPLWKKGINYGGEYDGSLNKEEFVTLFCQLAQTMEKSPFFYIFETPEGREPNDFICCWAHDLETAKKEVKETSKLSEKEFKNLKTKEIDDRIFPEKMPKFEILPKS